MKYKPGNPLVIRDFVRIGMPEPARELRVSESTALTNIFYLDNSHMEPENLVERFQSEKKRRYELLSQQRVNDIRTFYPVFWSIMEDELVDTHDTDDKKGYNFSYSPLVEFRARFRRRMI